MRESRLLPKARPEPSASDFNISPADYRDHRPLALSGRDLWENIGWLIFDRSEGMDIMFWFAPYRLIGRHPAGTIAVDDIALSQTLALAVSRRPGDDTPMRDTDFLAVGFDLGDYMPGQALEVRRHPEETVWQVGGRRFSAAPPLWRIEGAHAGIDVDLTLRAPAPGLWLTDPTQSVEESEELWLTACARARGTIAYADQTLSIGGYAYHERHVHCGGRFDQISALAERGVTWHTIGMDEAQVMVLSRPSRGEAWAKLVLPGETIDFSAPGHGYVIEETEHWLDPRSRLNVPCAWRCRFEGASGTMAIEGRAFARAYYLWPYFKRGCTVLYWWLGEANLSVDLQDGRSWRGDNVQYVIHDNRLLHRQRLGGWQQ